MTIKERHPPSLLERAIALAVEAHEGHRAGEGRPYILHPLRVMARVETDTERIVAILHDTVENGGDRVSFARLRQEGFPEEIVQAIDCLTRRDGELYADMIERIAPNPLARRVKLADLADNLDLLRQSELTQGEFEGLQMRLRAWHRLKNAAPDDTADRSASGRTS
jgi:(p)ppGpp synthase/HD superfamily hydrolase